MTRVALRGPGRAPRAHGPDHAGDRARRGHGERRVHADRHHAQRRGLAVLRRLRRHGRRRLRQDGVHRRVRRLGGQAPDGRRRTCSPASARCPRSASPSATSPTRRRSSPATASRPATAPTSASATTAARRAPTRPRRSGSTTAAGPPARDEVVIDANTAEKQDYGIGSTVKITTRGEAQEFEVVGISRFGEVKSLGVATTAVFDLRTAQELFGKQGSYDSILVAGRDGVPAADVRAAVAAETGSAAQVQTAAAPGPLHARRPQAVHLDHPDRADRVRLRRDPRRGVHDLQHALDHGRPALARVRAAADGRRRPPPGARLGDARGAEHRRAGLAHRPRRRVRHRRRAGRRVHLDGDRPARGGHGVRHPHDRGRACSSARS